MIHHALLSSVTPAFALTFGNFFMIKVVTVWAVQRKYSWLQLCLVCTLAIVIVIFMETSTHSTICLLHLTHVLTSSRLRIRSQIYSYHQSTGGIVLQRNSSHKMHMDTNSKTVFLREQRRF